MPSLPLNLSLMQTQQQWSSQLNPILANPLLNGRLIRTALINGATIISHGLSRVQIGWILTDQDAEANIYRSDLLNDKFLVLTSDAAVTVGLWVF